jgi:Rho GDP-dissociation inhibitor
MDDEVVEGTPGYVPPKKVGLDTLKNLDKDDEALNRWKAALLAGASSGTRKKNA